MSFNTHIPQQAGGTLEIPVAIGKATFVVGPNGAGKSALMHRLFVQNRDASRRVTAHRQNWFASNTVEMAPNDMIRQISTMRDQDTIPTARYTEWQSGVRPGYVIYELLSVDNARSRDIAALVTKGNIVEAERKAVELGPLQIISELMQRSNMPIVVSADDRDALVASKNNSAPYSISALSDGERNAFLIGANVVLAPPGALILIDEPERHLHRSIMAPFLVQLFARRPDCAFVVSTHDLEVPAEHPDSPGVLVRECIIQGDEASAWQIDIVNPIGLLDESIRTEVLGCRRKVLFIEGASLSLDAPLYGLLLPGVTVQAKGACREVISHVRSIRGAEGLHWVKGYGIVDRDQLTATEVAGLRAEGVFPISCYSVESIYYHTGIQKFVADAFCRLSGEDPAPRLAEAKTAALASLQAHKTRLVQRMVERSVRHQLLASAPRWDKLQNPLQVSVDVPSLIAAEERKFDNLSQTQDLDGLMGRYPVKDTPLIGKIVEKLQLKNRGQYEAMALRQIRDKQDARQLVTTLLDGAVEAIEAG